MKRSLQPCDAGITFVLSRKGGGNGLSTLARRGNKMGKTIRFKDKESYRKWLAFGHRSGVFEATPGHQRVMIRGKKYKVVHKR